MSMTLVVMVFWLLEIQKPSKLLLSLLIIALIWDLICNYSSIKSGISELYSDLSKLL